MSAVEQTYTLACVELRRHVVSENLAEQKRWLSLANALIDCYPSLVPSREADAELNAAQSALSDTT